MHINFGLLESLIQHFCTCKIILTFLHTASLLYVVKVFPFRQNSKSGKWLEKNFLSQAIKFCLSHTGSLCWMPLFPIEIGLFFFSYCVRWTVDNHITCATTILCKTLLDLSLFVLTFDGPNVFNWMKWV